MPKKFQGQNSKAVEAKARKDAVRAEEEKRKQQALEDEMWRDDDKHVARKTQRKEERERKRFQQLEKKKELANMADQDMQAAVASATPARQSAAKVTQAQITAEQEKRQLEARKASGGSAAATVVNDIPLTENVNHLVFEGEEARNIDDAIRVLSVGGDAAEKHPEKRAHAAYLAFEERELPRLKEEFPNLRLSQLKQMLKKDWVKSPENPFNQNTASYNTKSGKN